MKALGGSEGVVEGGAGRGGSRGRVLTRRQAAAIGGADTIGVAAEGVPTVMGQAVPRARRGGRGRAGRSRVAIRGRGRGRAASVVMPLEEEAPDIYLEEVNEVGTEEVTERVASGVPVVAQAEVVSSVHAQARQQQIPVKYFMMASMAGGGSVQIPVMITPVQGSGVTQMMPMMMAQMLASTQGALPVAQPVNEQRVSRMMQFTRMGKDMFGSFLGKPDPLAAREWMAGVEDTFAALGCLDDEKVDFATYFLADQARLWWRAERIALGGEAGSWTAFRAAFFRKYFPESFRARKRKEFLYIEQGSRTVSNYAAEFEMLSEFAPRFVADDQEKAEHFVRGLTFRIRDRLSMFDLAEYEDAVSRALRIEQTLEDISQTKHKLKQNRLVLTQVQYQRTHGQDSQVGGQMMQMPNQSTRGSSVAGEPPRASKKAQTAGQGGQTAGPQMCCFKCGDRGHLAKSRPASQSVCFICKKPGHFSKECPTRTQGACQGRPSQPLRSQSRGQQQSSQAQVRVYALTHQETQQASRSVVRGPVNILEALPSYDLCTIKAATNDFSNDNKLGQGGFGVVYKGELQDGQKIAVKKLSRYSSQGPDEFKNELSLIANLQHRNLVRLLGSCIEGDERLLIFEYLENGSLDAFIYDKTRSALLNWQKRLDIILGIARGLLYLHQDSNLRVIHRDLKPSNILLDKDMNPKISDFGIAKILEGDEIHGNATTIPIGTFGYMAPEYLSDGVFSFKSDVFSFGVIVLEILSGKRNKVFNQADMRPNLLGHAYGLWKEGRSLEILDDALDCSYPTAEILRCIRMGLLCVQENGEDRPTMAEAVMMLASEDQMFGLPCSWN